MDEEWRSRSLADYRERKARVLQELLFRVDYNCYWCNARLDLAPSWTVWDGRHDTTYVFDSDECARSAVGHFPIVDGGKYLGKSSEPWRAWEAQDYRSWWTGVFERRRNACPPLSDQWLDAHRPWHPHLLPWPITRTGETLCSASSPPASPSSAPSACSTAASPPA